MRKRGRGRKARSVAPPLLGLIVAAGLAVLVLVWLRPPPIEAQQHAKLVPQYILKLNGPISPASAGAIIAISDGLFMQKGLRVRLTSGAGDEDAIRAVVADQSTVGIASAAGFLKARSEGLPLVAFAAAYTVNSAEFFGLAGTLLRSPSDLEGKRIGYRPEPEFAVILNEFIAKNFLPQSRLSLLESQSPVQDLLTHKIDVILGHREVEGLELDRLNIDYQTLSPDSYGVHSAGPLYFVHEGPIGGSQALQRFFSATAIGWNAAYSDQNRATAIIASSLDPPIPASVISRFMDVQRRFLRPLGARFGELDTHRLRLLHEQLLRRHIIKEPLDLRRAINYDIVAEAYRTEMRNLNGIEP